MPTPLLHPPPQDFQTFLWPGRAFVNPVPRRLVLLLISNLTNGLRLHQFLRTKTTETNKPLKTDANGAH